MYNLSAYGKMIADTPRMDAYVAALRDAIKPDSVVVDLGCGPGFFAILACCLGARRVFAIEPSNAIQVGRDAAREYGFSDRIEFIQDLSTKVTLPEQAHVIVSDLRGVLPWFQHSISSIIDARTRLLRSEGVLIPRRDRLWAAVVETPARYAEIVEPWEANGYGVALNSGRNFAVNYWTKLRVLPENLLGQPVLWLELDYQQIEEVNFCQNISLPVARKGAAHGLSIWFDTELVNGVGFSNAPGGAELIYGQGFFPFQQPLEVAPGDRIDVRLEARLIGDDYVWRWDTALVSQNEIKCGFKQSTLFGTPLSAAQLRKRASAYVPSVNEEGAIARFVLSKMDGANSNEQIAAEVLTQFSSRFRNQNDALDLVTEISEKYSG
ncbi:MAG TPA: class I SAM-dependent methyltransferase [Pyrinomonadaceae bacterium]|nr:class I SAM-dependent methyltransferase [Pyrinomonadaceae bacterium]